MALMLPQETQRSRFGGERVLRSQPLGIIPFLCTAFGAIAKGQH